MQQARSASHKAEAHRRRWSRTVARAVAVLAGGALSLGTAEVALRVADYEPPISVSFAIAPNQRVPSPDVILVDPRFADDSFYAVEPGDEVIVTLGDSFTYGFPVGEQDTYPAVLEQTLRQQGRDAHVINMGMGGTGSDQHLRLFKTHVLPRLKPDVVVWALYPNDIADNVHQAVYTLHDDQLVPTDPTKHWLYRRQKFFEWLPLSARWKWKSRLVRAVLRAMEPANASSIPAERRAASLRKIQLQIEEMDRLAREHDFESLYVVIAPQSVYLVRDDPETWREHNSVLSFEQLCLAVGDRPDRLVAGFGSDHRKAIQGASAGTPTSSGVFDDGQRCRMSMGSRHFNELGYRLLGEAVAQRLQETDDHR